MTYNSVIYIDESGCDGISNFRQMGWGGGTSHWLTIACVIVTRKNDVLMPSWRDDIMSTFPKKKRRDLHFDSLDHEEKLVASEKIGKLPISVIAVTSNKTTIPNHRRKNLFHKKNTLYWYCCRYLLERASKHVYQSGIGPAKIIFSRRGKMDYDHFQDYMRLLKKQSQAHIAWNAIDIDLIEAIDHKKRAGLQLADGIAHSVHCAVEPSRLGTFEPRYAQNLFPKFIKSPHGKLMGVGIKPIPKISEMQLTDWQTYFFDLCEGKDVRPPGSCTTASLAAATSKVTRSGSGA